MGTVYVLVPLVLLVLNPTRPKDTRGPGPLGAIGVTLNRQTSAREHEPASESEPDVMSRHAIGGRGSFHLGMHDGFAPRSMLVLVYLMARRDQISTTDQHRLNATHPANQPPRAASVCPCLSAPSPPPSSPPFLLPFIQSIQPSLSPVQSHTAPTPVDAIYPSSPPTEP